ncbi:MAG: hypothetical protein FJ317_04740 [SAR202 cluster bacterium]|nr:hypothetical protein [SAR202 cluster bacterium]
MSKLTDKLEKVGQQTAAAFGFGAAMKKGVTNPAILAFGKISPSDAGKKSLDGAVDAVVVSLDKWSDDTVKKTGEALKGALWGVRTQSVSEDQMKKLRDAGCDFAVLDIGDTPSAVLNNEEFGVFLALGPALEEESARAIHELPMDGVFFQPKTSLFPITMESLFELLKVRSFIDKYLILETPAAIAKSDLETLRNVGVVGIVADGHAKGDLEATRKAIAELPKPKQKKDRAMALLPPQAQAEHVHEHDDDDDDGYDDDDGDDY